MTSILIINNARRTFRTSDGSALHALDNVTLNIAAGEFVTLLGPSGCGKTTLLRSMAGFEDLDSGTICIDGQEMDGVPPFKRPVNTVFQSYALFSHMSVVRNVAYHLEIKGVALAQRRQRANEALELVGLAGYGERTIDKLSGGQRQRVALARALVAKPKILLLDEPLSALDRQLRQQMQVELKALQNKIGVTFVFVTHDQEEALTMSDRIVVMRNGQIQQIGSPQSIYRHPVNSFVAEFIGDTNLMTGQVEADGSCAFFISKKGARIALPERPVAAGATQIVIRPNAFSLSAADGNHWLDVTITELVYRGSEMVLYCELADSGEAFHAALPPQGTLPRVGERAKLHYSSEDVHILPERSYA